MDSRVHSTETPLPGGGRKRVEEVERRSYAAPSEALRVEERTVEVLQPDGKGGLEGTREVQALDPNGRFVTIRSMQIKEDKSESQKR